MPTPKQYESATERQRAFRARRRQERLEAEEAERQAQMEAQRQEAARMETRTKVRQAIGEMIARWSETGPHGTPSYITAASGQEKSGLPAVTAYMREIAAALESGSTHLPR